jgi:hypothetical protein
MKPLDDQLNRLLKAAASAPRSAPGAAVFAQEARVLGNWRAALSQGEGGEWMLAAFRRAAICGCILALASVAWTYHGAANGGGALAVADSVLQRGGVEP